MRDIFPERIARTNELLKLTVHTTGVEEEVTATASGNRIAAAMTVPAPGGEPETRTQTPLEPPHTGTPSGGALSWSSPMLAAPPSPGSPAVILAVDDSLVGRKLVEAHLSAAGHQVLTCGSSEEALEVLAEIKPNLILLDVMMAGMNGFDLCRKIRETYPGPTPIVFVSAACSLAERTKGLEVGGDDFLRKPYEPADLVARVRSHLRRAATLRSTAPPEPP